MNGVGIGACSSDLIVLTDGPPSLMNLPIITTDDINPFWIFITWNPLTSDSDTGRSSIIYYRLEWD